MRHRCLHPARLPLHLLAVALPLLGLGACAPEEEEDVDFPDARVDGELVDAADDATELVSGLAWTDGDAGSLIVALTTYEVLCSSSGGADDWLEGTGDGDGGLVLRIVVEGASAGGAVLRSNGGSLTDEGSVDHSLSLTTDPDEGDDSVDGGGNFIPGGGAATGWSGIAAFSVPWCGDD
jgi:hypothetical protein